MIGTIIWLIGLILTIKAALEIGKTPGDIVKKLLFIILLLITSWIGLIVYYLFAKDKIAGWVK
jgi:ABC-type dipeptide/oligopeptide/nickel transport system permease component